MNGFMFTPGDLGDLTEQLDKLLSDEPLRKKLGQQAREEMEKWSWRASTERVLEYYDLARTIHRRYDPPSAY